MMYCLLMNHRLLAGTMILITGGLMDSQTSIMMKVQQPNYPIKGLTVYI